MAEFKVISSAFQDLIKNPWLAIPPAFLLVFTIAFSRFSVFFNYRLTSNFESTAWLIFYSILSLMVLSYLFTGLISLSKKAVKKESFSFKDFFASANRFWMKNFLIVLIVLVVYNILRLVSHYAAFYIGKAFQLPLSQASFVFYLIYFAGLALVIIYLALASFVLVIFESSVGKSIKKSIELVRSNYLFIFSIFVIFFVIDSLINMINAPLIQEIIDSLIIIPYLSLILTRIVLTSGKK